VSRRARFIALLLSVMTIAVVVGFLAAVALLAVFQAVLGPLRREDGDTLREFASVALAYATWAVGTAITLVLGWRRIRPYR